ncbi:MAG: metallophosphoesterase [Polyangiaceae bacterium]|jgi:predicted MPP superfamily phosphohydrolase
MSANRVLIATAVLSALSWLLHRYVWARLLRDAMWSEPWRTGLTVGVFALGALIPVAFLAIRFLPRAVHVPIAWVAYTWMGFSLYLLLLTATFDAARGVAALTRTRPLDPERRIALSRAIAKIVVATAGLIGLGGLANVARGFVLRRVQVPIAKLPSRASGYCIVQITDVHVGPTIGRDFVDAMVRATNALTPDLVVITGDLVDGSVEQLRHLVEPLRELRAKDGVFFVTGNHEYYSGADEWIAHLGQLGIRVLRNERVAIRDAFDLAGVDDASANRMLAHHGQDVARALFGRDMDRPVVLLAHQPKALKDALAARVDLQLSGHVHGGQMFPFNWLARIDQPLIAGLYRVEQTWVYVSTGTGYWGPPMRVGPRAELTRIELVAMLDRDADLGPRSALGTRG